MPALFSMACEELLPEHFIVVGVARTEMDNESFRQKVKEGIEQHSRLKPDECRPWPNFATNLFYHQANYDDPAGYEALGKLLGEIDAQRNVACTSFSIHAPHLPTIVERSRPGWLNKTNQTAANH
jgi:glucose-6-phosphate 1-dehydrogenase